MSTERKKALDISCDLVIIGGGIAGLCAALAAARNGVNTAIVQDRPVFGGCASSEIRVLPGGAADSNGWAAETGIVMELLEEDAAHNHMAIGIGVRNSQFDMTLYQAAKREQNLAVFLNTTVRTVDSEPIDTTDPHQRRITAVHGSQLGTEKEFTFRARQFIDATGDGTVGYLAGADWRYGREARSEFEENLAPVVSDEQVMGSTILFCARDSGKLAPFTAPPWIADYRTPEDLGIARPILDLGRPLFGGYWWIEICGSLHQIDDTEAVRDELHRHVLGVWNYLKNCGPDRDKLLNHELEWYGMLPGKRESRRLIGDVIVTENDLHNDRNWPDGVCYAGWWIDLHMPGGILNKQNPGEREDLDENYKHWIRISPVSVPLRAFYSRNVVNLWMTGRDASVTHAALGPLREMLTLGAEGQAVGTAAAYAVVHGIGPRVAASLGGPHITAIRQQLLRDDARVLGLRNNDSSDLALAATVTASSEASLDFEDANTADWVALDRPLGQVVPLTAERLDCASFYLRNESGAPVSIKAELEVLDRIWDRPRRQSIAGATVGLPAAWEGWVDAAFSVKVQPDRSYRLILNAARGVKWARANVVPTGTLATYLWECEGGPQDEHKHISSLQPNECLIPAYRHWRQILDAALATRLSPTSEPYGPSNINNGCAWPEDMPNLWISDPVQPMPQFVQLHFVKAERVDCVYATFDPNLSIRRNQKSPYWKAPLLVRDWRILAQVDGAWVTVFEETGNWRRRRIVRFPSVAATAIRLEVLATNQATNQRHVRAAGGDSGRIYEVRAYNTGGRNEEDS